MPYSSINLYTHNKLHHSITSTKIHLHKSSNSNNRNPFSYLKIIVLMESQTKTPYDYKRRRTRWWPYIIGGFILQIFIILVFLYVILRVRTIKLRLQSAKVENLKTSNKSSLSMLLHTQVTIKNSNFGHYKFENSTVILAYRGTQVGEAWFGNGRVKARSAKKIDVVVAVSFNTLMGSGSGHGGLGKITLTASAHVTGKVHILKAIRRRKLAQMNCVIDVDTKSQAIDNLHCK